MLHLLLLTTAVLAGPCQGDTCISPTFGEFVRVPAGTHRIGFLPDEKVRPKDPDVVEVVLRRPVYLMRTEVTQAMWHAVAGDNPSIHQGCPDCPVEHVSWEMAVDFANRASAAEGLTSCYTNERTWTRPCTGYRLPTEAEWEIAARAGERHLYAGSDSPTDVAWMGENANPRSTHTVAAFQPNAWGLYDMTGNVMEWCWDAYGPYAAGTDPMGPGTDTGRVVRGGGWPTFGYLLRVGQRLPTNPTGRAEYIGFRLARTGEPDP